ncbi:MAG: hypothetical protein AUH18_09030 [Candidatus Rokubacteria bacterium 13_2_20CM_69_10]|nr:MAG: hypothetical protein AUH18_09030 [Candidatus Rokubacteria bacterium 13_2_20CM_69_10]
MLGDASARGSDVEKAEHHYLAAIALASELEMRPGLASGHLGIGRLYLPAGDRVRAEDHLLLATRLFVAMNMPLWLQRAVTSLSELGRVLIVARNQRGLFDYLSRALVPGAPLRVVLGDDSEPVSGQSKHNDRRRAVRSHGLSIAEQ